MRRRLLCLLLSIAIVTCSTYAAAATLNVDGGTGDDATSYADVAAGNGSWRTLERALFGATDSANPNAAEAAQTGDTIVVAAGVYETTAVSGERYAPALNPINAAEGGTEADRITIRAEGVVELRGTASDGPLIGTYRKHFVTWDGFTIDEQYVDTRPDTGPVVVWTSQNIELLNLTIIGNPNPIANWTQADNHNGIRIEDTNNVTVRGCTISGFTHAGTGESSRNAAGIMTYSSANLVIESNTIIDNRSGAYIKGINTGPQEAMTFRYNWLQGNVTAMEILGLGGAASTVSQNVFFDNDNGLLFVGMNGTPNNVTVANNTFVDHANSAVIWVESLEQEGQNLLLRNSLVDGTGLAALAWENGATTVLDSQHHCLNSTGAMGSIGFDNKSLAEWQTQTGQDQDAPATVEADPSFVDRANQNFVLSPMSPCREIGVDVLDLDGDNDTTDLIPAGAYIAGDEVIGSGGMAPPIMPMDGMDMPAMDMGSDVVDMSADGGPDVGNDTTSDVAGDTVAGDTADTGGDEPGGSGGGEDGCGCQTRSTSSAPMAALLMALLLVFVVRQRGSST